MTTPLTVGRNPVRQQLDELDALLQRMLALPVNQLDGAPAAAEPRTPPLASPPIDQPPRAPVTPSLRDGWKQPAMMLLTDSGPVQPPSTPEPQRWEPSWGINLNPQNGSSVFAARTPVAMPERAAPPPDSPTVWRSETVDYAVPDPPPESPSATAAVEPPTSGLIPEPAFRPRHTPRPDPPSLLAMPFAALDQLFDTVVSLIPLGSLLTTQIGKHCIGVAGIVMVTGGVTWGILDFLGWTH